MQERDFLDDLIDDGRGSTAEADRPCVAVLQPASCSMALEIFARYLELEPKLPIPFIDEDGNPEKLTEDESATLVRLGISEAEWNDLVGTPEGLQAVNRARHDRACDALVAEIERGKYPRECLEFFPLNGEHDDD